MTQRRELAQRLTGMAEIGEIMRSMKNLAYLETHKLARLIESQQSMVQRIDAVAADFMAFHPEVLPTVGSARSVYLVVGARRGFCGDFNEQLQLGLQRELAGAAETNTAVVAVGRKLCLRLQRDVELTASLDGADAAEEIPAVLRVLVAELAAQQARYGPLALTALWHPTAASAPSVRQLLPPFAAHRGAAPTRAFAPLLNLGPQEFLLGLAEQYLFAVLHAVLNESLLAENERRMRHLDGAVHYLEERSEALQWRVRALRQEEMIEEIEVILLNATGLDEPETARQPVRR